MAMQPDVVTRGGRSESETLADHVVREQQRIAGNRGNWEDHCQQIAEVCAPDLGSFTGVTTPGARNTRKLLDSTAALAVENFTAAMVDMITPREQIWHGLRSGIAELDKLEAVKLYFEAVRDALFYYRYAPRAKFTNQFWMMQKSQTLFGPGALWVDEMPGGGIFYRNVHVAEVYAEENHQGVVDTVYRRATMSATEWKKRWGERQGALPPQVREALAAGQGHREYEFIHCIRPNPDYEPGRLGWRGMKVQSIVVGVADRWLVSMGGFRSMPLIVSRYTSSPREPMGRSPAMRALPDIKMVNEVQKTLAKAGHRAVTPPLLVHDDGVLSKLSLMPDAVNIGTLDRQGRPLVRPLDTGGNLPYGIEMVEMLRKTIERAFLIPLFSILTETPDRMTATEVLERAKEKGALISPAAGMIEGEALGPIIEREIDILAEAGLLPPVPPELAEAGSEYRITYDNPLQVAARSGRSIGMLRWVEATASVAAVKPEIWDLPNWREWGRKLAEDSGVPLSLMRSDDELDAEDAANAERQQVAEALQGAAMAGDAAQKLAQAQQMAGLPGV